MSVLAMTGEESKENMVIVLFWRGRSVLADWATSMGAYIRYGIQFAGRIAFCPLSKLRFDVHWCFKIKKKK